MDPMCFYAKLGEWNSQIQGIDSHGLRFCVWPFQKRGVCLCEANAPPELLSQVWRKGETVGDLGALGFPSKKTWKDWLGCDRNLSIVGGWHASICEDVFNVCYLVVFWGRSKKNAGQDSRQNYSDQFPRIFGHPKSVVDVREFHPQENMPLRFRFRNDSVYNLLRRLVHGCNRNRIPTLRLTCLCVFKVFWVQ